MISTLAYPNNLLQFALAFALSLACYWYLWFRRRSSSNRSMLHKLRGPKASTFLGGNYRQLIDPSPSLLEEWENEYGSAYTVHSVLSQKALYICDPKACAYVLNKSNEFPKTWQRIFAIKSMAGPGIVAAVGDVHKRQRRILAPAFSLLQTKQLVPTILNKVYELKDIWVKNVTHSGIAPHAATIRVLHQLSNVTLDIIGEAGFGYHFNTLYNTDDEMARALTDISNTTSGADIVRLLGILFPVLGRLPLKRNKVLTNNLVTMTRVGKKIVADKRKELEVLASAGERKDLMLGKDLLSVLIKSNDNEKENQRLSDEEVVAQIATFIVAGHDSTACTVTWALYALAKNPRVQKKLRQELLAFPNDHPSYDDLQAMEYLDLVTKEILRRHNIAHLGQRCAAQDEVIPLRNPIVDKDGVVHNEIMFVVEMVDSRRWLTLYDVSVKEGDAIMVSIANMTWSKSFWGPDAHEFRPERFLELPAATYEIPAIWANLMSFWGGPRACIGWRFALAEVKTILFVMIRTFEFGIDPMIEVEARSVFAARPYVLGTKETVPLLVSLYRGTV